MELYLRFKQQVQTMPEALCLFHVIFPIKISNIQPGNVATSLHAKSTDQSAQKRYGSLNEGQYLKPEDIAMAVSYALNTPFNVAVNEILVKLSY